MRPLIVESELLAKYTSWRIGGPARALANPTTPDELRAAIAWAQERDLPLCILGGGTNVLVRDGGFPGLVLRYRAQDVRISDGGSEARVWVAAGAPMAGTARRLAAQGWGGLQWAEGLPGTVGGAVFGNAGCYGGDIAAVLTRAWLLLDGEVVEWPVERFTYAYRASALRPSVPGMAPTVEAIVVAAEFGLTRADPQELAEQMRRIAAERRSKTPVGSSCGSVFKNPPGESAGRLIEAAGLKGTRIGGAEISPKHANYIVNCGGASSDDVLRLIELARARVLKEFGVELELEVQIVG
jgi:UDP-N-acetylmuramate dehydrogenase